MRKLITAMLAASFVIALAGVAVAELDMDAKSFYAQGMLTLPTGDFGDFAGTGFGGGLGMEVPYSEVLSFRGEAGYIMYGSKDFLGSDYTIGMVPITVLGEYHMEADSPAFLLGGLGLTMVRQNLKGTYTEPFTGTTITIDEDNNTTEFTLTAGGGYQVNEQIAIEGRFNIISDTNYISVHGTYAF